ncbi:alpha/beta hydrolase [Erythrobacter sp. JK5]|uniref:alpha/beta hydrolase n=1 Tax=Erythrobacter sp. JK5 TaxID=2829500 RepID=UPI001BACFFBA|nr:alpha/beta hydrolase [Erythrobacter sp. JK5]QUL37209.1 alpha/beta hydrolase [Erythrobacter sp. JK5]
MVWWTFGIIVLLIAGGGAALQFAIARNGPAVLSTVDRLAGGDAGGRMQAAISIGDHPAQKLIVWGPQSRDPSGAPLPVLLFVHGGSWNSGDPADYGFFARAFVPKGFVVVLAGYRKHPDAVYPAMLEDTAVAVAWTRAEIAGYGGDPDRITLVGHSAGAYNVVQVALERQWLGRRGLAADDLAGVVGLAGPYDFYPFDSDSAIASFGDADDPAATQPVNHVRADAPPLLLIHGEKDTLVKPRNTRELAKRIAAAGGRVTTRFYPAMNHNDPLVSLAAPWRSRRDVDDLIAEFALSATRRDETSVPVQAETR